MTSIAGVNNWRLTVRREKDSVTILRAATCDERAALPDELFGLRVTALGDHALALDARPVEGEGVVITGAPSALAWDNHALRELTMPNALAAVGDYALMSCRALKTLRLADRPIKWGTGALMNCRALDTFMLTREDGADYGAAAYFANELARELDISILETGKLVARLIIPEYYETYEENSPAHHFDYKVYGAGQPYHHVFRDRKLNLYDYDALWPKFLAGDHEPDTALRLAWWRVCCPMRLAADAAARYWDYLAAHAAEALRFLLSQRDTAMLRAFLRRVDCDAETLRGASALAREDRDTAATAVLLEELHRKSGAGKTFDL